MAKLTEMTTCSAVPAATAAPMQITFNTSGKSHNKSKKRHKRPMPSGKSLIDSILDLGAADVVELQAHWD